MKEGRPTLVNDELVERAERYLLEFENYRGDVIPTVRRLARVLGVSRKSIYNWAGVPDSAFETIVEDLNDDQCADLINKGLDNKFAQSTVKLMLGRHGITEKTATEISGPDGASIMYADLSDDELDRHIDLKLEEYERSKTE